jgi:hypothetical protein
MDLTLWSLLQEQVANKVALTEYQLREAVQGIRDAVGRCFPEGLPPYDPVQQELEVGTAVSLDTPLC